jgi:hypothetical protein
MILGRIVRKPSKTLNGVSMDLWKERINSFHIGTDQLWVAVILAGFLFFTSLIPLIPNDFWWHMKIGEIIFHERSIPATNIFAWTIPQDQPFTYGAWLGELLFYTLFRLGNLEVLIFLRNLFALVAFWLVAVEAKRKSGSWRLAALVTAFAWLMSFNNLAVRPQIWSWISFMAYLIVLEAYIDGRVSNSWLWSLPLIMVFWVNAHGAFVLGVVLIGIYFIGELLSRLLKLPEAISPNRVKWLGLISLITILAIVINPQGVQIIDYVIDLITDPPSQGLISEWQSPTPQGVANITFFLSILLFIIALSLSRYRLTITETFLIVGFLWLAWSGQRYIIWYALIVMPVLAKLLAKAKSRSPGFKARKNQLNVLLAAVIFLPVILVQPWFVGGFPLPQAYWDFVIHESPEGPPISRNNPVSAVDYLSSHPGGKIFNEMGYGSYLIWALPSGSVFIDPRVELYPFEQWEDYINISQARQYNQLLAKYEANRILLHKTIQAKLAEALVQDPSWKKEYEDRSSQIWMKIDNSQ